MDVKFDLAGLYQSLGSDQAAPLYAACLAGRRARLGSDHDLTLQAVSALAGAHAASGRARDRVLALPLYEEFVAALRRRLRALPTEEGEEEDEGEGAEGGRGEGAAGAGGVRGALRATIAAHEGLLVRLKKQLAATHSGPWPRHKPPKGLKGLKGLGGPGAPSDLGSVGSLSLMSSSVASSSTSAQVAD